jgi:hypothetical protein
MLINICHQGNARQNPEEMSPHTCEMTVDQGVEKRIPLLGTCGKKRKSEPALSNLNQQVKSIDAYSMQHDALMYIST